MKTTPPNGFSSRRRSADGLLEVITPDDPPELTEELARALLHLLLRKRAADERQIQSRDVAS